jgi:hypothetical protein
MIMTITRALVKHPHDRRLAAGRHLGPFELVITVTPSVAHGAGQLGHRPPASRGGLPRWSRRTRAGAPTMTAPVSTLPTR